MSEDQEKKPEDNKPQKGYLIMILVGAIVAVLFFKFVIPAMEAGTKPPSSILTGEEN